MGRGGGAQRSARPASPQRGAASHLARRPAPAGALKNLVEQTPRPLRQRPLIHREQLIHGAAHPQPDELHARREVRVLREPPERQRPHHAGIRESRVRGGPSQGWKPQRWPSATGCCADQPPGRQQRQARASQHPVPGGGGRSAATRPGGGERPASNPVAFGTPSLARMPVPRAPERLAVLRRGRELSPRPAARPGPVSSRRGAGAARMRGTGPRT